MSAGHFEYVLRLADNALILGPGGYRFGDYWRLGLPLEIVIVSVALPAIVLYWGV